jgi:hypothetical protein
MTRKALGSAMIVALLTAAVGAEDAATSSQSNAQCRMERAGCANEIAPWARWTYNEEYCGQWIGGGTAVGGEGRCLHEGTWGMNYAPRFTRIHLNWSHGRRRQDGGGQYEPDGKLNPFEAEHRHHRRFFAW